MAEISIKRPFETAQKLIMSEFMVDGFPTLWYRAGTWWLWDGSRYVETHEESINRQIYYWLSKCQHLVKGEGKTLELVRFDPTPKAKADVLDSLKSLCLMPSKDMPQFMGEGWPEATNIISFSNGLLDFEAYLRGEGKLIPHTPQWLSASCLPFPFEEGAECPVWADFVADVMMGDAEAMATLQKWFGLMMTSDTRHQRMLMLTGTGRNGKGVTVRTLMKLLGEANYCTPTMSDMQNRFQRSKWLGKLAAIVPDAHMGRESDAIEILQWLKLVVGEDRVDLDRKNKEPLTGVKLTTRVTISCNEVPRLPDASKAIGARMIFLPFHRSYLGREDLTLEDRIARELPGILLWALEGLRQLRAEGISQPAIGAGIAKDFNESSSPIDKFVTECCEIDPNHQCIKEDFRRVLNIWLDNHGYKTLSDGQVTSKLRAVISTIECVKPRVGNGQKVPCFKGIRVSKETINQINYNACNANVIRYGLVA